MKPSPLAFAPAAVEVETRFDGTIRLRSPMPLEPTPEAITAWLEHWARRSPDRVFLAERGGIGWRQLSYAETLAEVRRIAQGLLDRGASPGRPVAILSDNSLGHALVTLAALHVGIPVVPVSPAYSLLSTDFAKLRAIFALVEPGIVWTDDPGRFAAALDAVGARAAALDDLRSAAPGPEVARARAVVTRDTVAKVLFTSGSTGTPKGVVNTHGMLVANQQMMVQGWPFITRRPPVIVDWLPWNHTFGGNHNFHLVLRNGGTLFIDGGRPVPGRIDETVRNLTAVSPTFYFNVPRGFDLLMPRLESDTALRRSFFRELDAVFYAAAALPQNLWERLEALAVAEGRDDLAMLSAWGSTETSPLATQVHFHIERAGVIGLPVAGCELKLVPSAGKLEVRVRGPHVTPGYYRRDDLTARRIRRRGLLPDRRCRAFRRSR